jgi:hypothetical protein
MLPAGLILRGRVCTERPGIGCVTGHWLRDPTSARGRTLAA